MENKNNDAQILAAIPAPKSLQSSIDALNYITTSLETLENNRNAGRSSSWIEQSIVEQSKKLLYKTMMELNKEFPGKVKAAKIKKAAVKPETKVEAFNKPAHNQPQFIKK